MAARLGKPRRARQPVPPVTAHMWVRAVQCCALAVLTLWVAAAVDHHRVSVPLLALVGGVIAGTLVLCVAAATGSESLGLVWVALLGAAFALGWSIYAKLTTPYEQYAVVSLLLAGVVFTPAAALALGHHEHAKLEAAKAREAAENRAALAQWREVLEGVGIHGVTCTRVVTTRAGHTITYLLPKTGTVTLGTLTEAAVKVATSLELQHPEWVRFEVGKHMREALMHVTERDVMADTVPYPASLAPMSINEPFDIGVSDDGTLALITFREVCLLVVGLRGSGKTNLLNVLIAQLARCVDVIVFGIDLKGGALLAPWVKPWAEGKCARPVIDWPATDRPEAEKLLEALIRLIHQRSFAHAGTKDKIVPSTRWPAYVLVVDEISELWSTAEPKSYRDKHQPEGTASPSALGHLGTRIVNTGRGPAVDAILGALRSTVTNLPSDIKAQCDLRIGLKVTTLAEAANLIPDQHAAAKLMSRLKHPGMAMVWRKDKGARADKIYRLDTPQVEHIAIETGDNIRPAPPASDLQALGADYHSRWERLRPVLDRWGSADDEPPLPGSFEAIVASVPDPEAGHSAARKRMVELVAESGHLGINPGLLATKLGREGFGTTRYTVQRWLADDSRIEKLRYGRWRITRGAGQRER